MYVNDKFMEHIKSNRPLVFIMGTGVSVSISRSSVGSWYGWLREGLKYAEKSIVEYLVPIIETKDALNLINAAELLKHHLNESGLYDTWMKDTIGALLPQDPSIIKPIKQLMALNATFLTTNYDLLVDNLLPATPLSYQDKKEIYQTLKYNQKDRIIHLHGYYREGKRDDTIASTSDYEQILNDDVFQFLQKCFSLQPIIFVGCGATYEDPNIGRMINWVTNLDMSIQHYSLVREGDVPILPDNVIPIYYGKDYSELPQFLTYLSCLRIQPNRIGYMESYETKIEDLYYLAQWAPFCGRKEELINLTRFCEEKDKFLWGTISGGGGQGKSRLYLEWRKNNLPFGWYAFILEKNINIIDISGIANTMNTVVAVDYVAGREKLISDFFTKMYTLFQSSEFKLRIILIERSNSKEYGGWLDIFINTEKSYRWPGIIKERWPNENSSLAHLSSLQEKDIKDMTLLIFEKLEYQYSVGELEGLTSLFLKKFIPKFRRPLYLQIFVLNWIRNRDSLGELTDQIKLLDWVLKKEQERWQQVISRNAPTSEIAEEMLDNWKDILCFNAATGKSIGYDTVNDLPESIQNSFKGIVKHICGRRKDYESESKLSEFFSDMLGSDNSKIELFAIWPDQIIGHFFLRFLSQEHLDSFTKMCLSINKDYFEKFVSKLKEDFPTNPLTTYFESALGLQQIVNHQSEATQLSVNQPESTPTLPTGIQLELKTVTVPEYADNVITDLSQSARTLKVALDTKYLPLPQDTNNEYQLLQKINNGDIEARNRLITANLRLVTHIVKKYMTADYSDDLISIGTIGLIKAADTFKCEQGVRFALYASRCIENEILKYIGQNRKHIRDLSLDDLPFDNFSPNDLSLADVLDYDLISHIEERIDTSNNLNQLKQGLQKLTDRERTVLVLKYGLDGQDPKTEREIALLLGISRSYVSTLSGRAIYKLRDILGSKQIDQ